MHDSVVATTTIRIQSAWIPVDNLQVIRLSCESLDLDSMFWTSWDCTNVVVVICCLREAYTGIIELFAHRLGFICSCTVVVVGDVNWIEYMNVRVLHRHIKPATVVDRPLRITLHISHATRLINDITTIVASLLYLCVSLPLLYRRISLMCSSLMLAGANELLRSVS